MLQRVIKRGPFPLNKYGHPVVTFMGRHLTGVEEVACLASDQLEVEGDAEYLFTRSGEYDRAHRIEERLYRVALMPSSALGQGVLCTTDNVRACATSFGYGKPFAGMMPRICELVSDEQMVALKTYFLAIIHDPIGDAIGHPSVFQLRRGYTRQVLEASWETPMKQWYGAVTFAYPMR